MNNKNGFFGISKKIDEQLSGSTLTKITNFKGLENCNVKDVFFGGCAPKHAPIEASIKIDNIGGLPAILTSFVTSNLRSVSGIHKQCPNLEYLRIDENVPDGLLSILRTRNPNFEFHYRIIKDDTGLCNVYEIIQKHVKGDRNVFDCQEELLVNGLKRYAKL